LDDGSDYREASADTEQHNIREMLAYVQQQPHPYVYNATFEAFTAVTSGMLGWKIL
jgi:hypothetical protein